MPKKLETTDYTVLQARRIGGKMRQVGDTVALTEGTAAHLVNSGVVADPAAPPPPASPAPADPAKD